MQVLKLLKDYENRMLSIPLIVDRSLINLDDNFIFSLILISTCRSLYELLIKTSEQPTSKLDNNGISFSKYLFVFVNKVILYF